jgi:mRNA interferase MazF
MRRGEVWWVEFPQARGGEIQKTRPAIIISNNSFNRIMNRVQVVPLTSHTAKVFIGETLASVGGNLSKALATQITTVTKERVLNRLGEITADEMTAVENAILSQLGIALTLDGGQAG